MEIRRIPITRLKPADHNPRKDLKPGDPIYEKIKRSIREFGLCDPLIWNQRTGNLVGGHQRLKILKEMGFEEVEVSVVDLPLEREKLLCVGLNRISGEFDGSKLAEMVDELCKLPAIDITVSGFDLPEIGQILDRYTSDDDDDPNLNAYFDPSKTPITRPGDVVQLGNHRVLCGDSTDRETVKKLMSDDRARLVVTDPPYRSNYIAEQRPTNKRKKPKWTPILNDNLSKSDYAALLERTFRNMREFLAPGSAVYAWNGFANFGQMHDLLATLGFHVASVIVWDKSYPSPSFADYQWQCEFLLYSWLQGNGAHRWFGPPDASNVWKCKRDIPSELRHPSQKPVELTMRVLRNSSLRDDIIYDPYLGSGSALIASERLGRRCYGIELEPSYIDALVTYFIKTFGPQSVVAEVYERYMKGV